MAEICQLTICNKIKFMCQVYLFITLKIVYMKSGIEYIPHYSEALNFRFSNFITVVRLQKSVS